MALLEFLTSRATASWCRIADEIGLCILIVSTLVLLAGFTLVFMWRRRSAHARLYLLKVMYVTVPLCLLIPFVPATKGTSMWAVSLPELYAPPSKIAPFVPRLPNGRIPSPHRVRIDASGHLDKLQDPLPPIGAYVEPEAIAPDPANPAAAYEILVAIWFIGVCWQLVRLCRSLIALRRVVDASSIVAAHSPLGRQFAHHYALSGPSRPLPVLRTHAELPSPILVELPKPCRRSAILIPFAYATHLGESEMDAVLSHELGHWRHRDCDWYLVAGLIGAVLWVQPLLHLLCRTFKELCEQARDSEVVAGGCPSTLYASLLLGLAGQQFVPGARLRSFPSAPGILHSRSSLERRIRHIVDQKPLTAASRRWMDLPLFTRALVAGSLSFVVVAGVALLDRTPAANQGIFIEPYEKIDSAHPKYLVSSEDSTLYSGPEPDGIVAFSDVDFSEPLYRFSDLNYEVVARYRSGYVDLIELPQQTLHRNDPRGPETVFWSQPIAEASFHLKTEDGVHTLSDNSGHRIWSDASRRPVPDLQVLNDGDGNVRLLDGGGQQLWSGHPYGGGGGFLFTARSHGGTIRHSSVNGSSDYEFTTEMRNLTISGNNGIVKLSDEWGRTLWSGASSQLPVLHRREGREFSFVASSGAFTGHDQSVRIHFEAEKTLATVESKDHKKLGIAPVELLKSFRSVEPAPGDDVAAIRRANTWQVEYSLPGHHLAVPGTVFVTYRSPAGHILSRSKRYNN